MNARTLSICMQQCQTFCHFCLLLLLILFQLAYFSDLSESQLQPLGTVHSSVLSMRPAGLKTLSGAMSMPSRHLRKPTATPCCRPMSRPHSHFRMPPMTAFSSQTRMPLKFKFGMTVVSSVSFYSEQSSHLSSLSIFFFLLV